MRSFLVRGRLHPRVPHPPRHHPGNELRTHTVCISNPSRMWDWLRLNSAAKRQIRMSDYQHMFTHFFPLSVSCRLQSDRFRCEISQNDSCSCWRSPAEVAKIDNRFRWCGLLSSFSLLCKPNSKVSYELVNVTNSLYILSRLIPKMRLELENDFLPTDQFYKIVHCSCITTVSIFV